MAHLARGRTRHRDTRSDRGAAAVEFALVLVVLLLIIFGIIDFGRLFFAVQGMKSASREAARIAVVHGSVSDVNNAVDGAAGAPVGLAGSGLGDVVRTSVYDGGASIPLTYPNTSATDSQTLCSGTADGPLTLRLSVPFRWFTPTGIFASGINKVEAETTMRCEPQ